MIIIKNKIFNNLNIKNCNLLFFFILFFTILQPNAVAEMGYNITTGKFFNKVEEDQENKEIKTGDKYENQIKLKINGLFDFQYFYADQPDIYKQDVLPNGLLQSPATIQNSSIYNTQEHTLSVMSKVDINPEFVRYRPKKDQVPGLRKEILKVGMKISQPFQRASKSTDPKMMSREFIYFDTEYFRFELGSVESSASKMRVDPSGLASGNGGVYGNWWRYISLPVFNTAGMSSVDATALNAMSPVFILYPTLPNEAGFTTQRFSVGQEFNANMFANGIVNANNLLYSARGQGYPTQGANSNKISIYTKRIYGFKFGFSFSPNTGQSGYITKEINGYTPRFNNVLGGEVRNYMSFALDYRKQWDKYGIGFATFIAYEMGQATNVRYLYNQNGVYSSIAVSGTDYHSRHDLSAVAVGTKFIWKNYSIAYSYGYWGNSLLQKNKIIAPGAYQIANQGKESYYHSVGIGATYGPISLGLTYMRSNMAGNKLDAWSVGSSFKAISLKYLHICPYVEYVGYRFHKSTAQLIVGGPMYTTIKNNGFVIIGGVRAIF